MKKKLTSFDMEKDEWYYQPKIYFNTKGQRWLDRLRKEIILGRVP